MIEVPSPNDRIVVVGDFKFFGPEELFMHWVTPDRLELWWPQKASCDARVGGSYHFLWPDMGWELSGSYTSMHIGRHLGFTWSWKHEERSLESQQVDVYFQPLEQGTRMAIYHGPFRADDQKDRQGVLEGWIHFGMRLAGLKRTAD